MTARRSIDELPAEARAGLVRLAPHEAFGAQQDGALPGAVVVERTVLEWRLDPACEARLPLASYDRKVVVCNEGYSSSLAAATLRELGVDATDLDGGFRAWSAAGLPTKGQAP